MASQARRFWPLKDDSEGVGAVLRGIVFDVDGTLCLPQNYMFGEMRAALNIDKSTDVLDHIHALPQPAQDEAHEKIKAIERAAMSKQQPQQGLVELMDYLQTKGLRKGICTRNFDAPVAHLLDTFLPGHTMHPIITRSFRPPKPDPTGILHIAAQWAVADGWGMPVADPLASQTSKALPQTAAQAPSKNPERDPGGHTLTSAAARAATGVRGPLLDVIMVGDSVDDMTAGWRAGAATVLLVNAENAHLAGHEHTDLVVEKLGDLVGVLEGGFVGRERG